MRRLSAFARQTRACGIASSAAYEVTVVAKGLEKPWAVEPLPDGDLLVTEKPGRLRIVSAAGQLAPPIAGLPAVDARGQGGLLDVALSPGFATDRTIFWSFSEPRGDGNGTSIARGTLTPDRRRLEDVRVIFRVQPTYDGVQHFGDRLAFGPDGTLWEVGHGTRGGDIEYAGGPIRAGSTQKAGTEQPVYYWDPVIAPSGSQVYTGSAFPAWRGSIFMGSLGQKRLVRLVLANGRVVGEEHLLVDRDQRIRDVRQGPDGALYVVTDDANGELWRITPAR